MEYAEFIASKRVQTKSYGFDVADGDINQNAWEWQRRIIAWSLKRGRAALFLDTGLGKTLCQLEWAAHVSRHTGGLVLLHCPIGVRQQTIREAAKFSVQCDVIAADDDSQLPSSGVVVANYEKIHRFNTRKFTGVVLDESSILKSFTGSTKRTLCNSWDHADFRLACTATPSPNDHMELGNHSQFLGVMDSPEMLSRWFYNDTMQAGGYKILPHGEADFWQWVATWAACVSMPSDIGGDDDGYVLPKLRRIDHTVEAAGGAPDPGRLFHVDQELSATTIHREKRRSTDVRAAKVAEIVLSSPAEPWLIWCDTDYEADKLAALIPESVNLKGSDKERDKERKLFGFASGEITRLITKPTVAGFGMNWQHCRRMAFIGLSYSFEQYYQAVRRCWRFGQPYEVHAHVVMADGEAALLRTNERKQLQHLAMQDGMRTAINSVHALAIGDDKRLSEFTGTRTMEIPQWL